MAHKELKSVRIHGLKQTEEWAHVLFLGCDQPAHHQTLALEHPWRAWLQGKAPVTLSQAGWLLCFLYINFVFFVLFYVKKYFKKFVVQWESDKASMTEVYFDYTNIVIGSR